MGNKCVNGRSTKDVKKKPLHSLLPSDIQNFNPESLDYTLPKVMFQAQIFNIQLMNCPQGVYSLNFQIADVISIMLPQKQIQKQGKSKSNLFSRQLQWKLHEKFGFAMTQFQLRSTFLIVQIFGQKKVKLNELLVNLYMIVTGPQHHDLQVVLSSDKFSRLKFDCKISQVVEVNINVDEIKITFDQDMEGQQFDYSFKIIRNNQVISFSQSKNPKFIKSPQQKNIYRQPTLDDQCKSPLKFRKSITSNKLIKRDLSSYAIWGQQDYQGKPFLIGVSAKLLSNDINNSFFYFLVWKFSKIQGTESNIQDDWKLFAGSLINFNKLFEKPKHQNFFINQQKQEILGNKQKIGFELEQRQVFLEQPLWGQDGNTYIGKCTMKLKMRNPTFQKQLQACARTQDGIVNMTFLFRNYIGKNNRLQNTKISKIIDKYQQIEQVFRKLSRLPRDSYSSRTQIFMLQEQAYEDFQEIAQQFKTSLDESYIVLSSSNPQQLKQLIQDQNLLIQLLEKLYYNINDNTIYATICWQIVLTILKRGQFYLENIGFMNADKTNQFIYEKKIATAIKYQSILYKYFLLALKNQVSTIKNTINSNIEAFKAYCYIKIPSFRQKLIDTIQKAYDQDIVEFKLQQLDQATSDMSSRLKRNNDRSIINLTWDKYFHDEIKGNEQNSILERQVLQEIENSQWIEEISKRQEAFFNFTAQLVKKLNQLTQRVKTKKWSYFPGYTKIVRGFIVEMKKRKISDYPSLMIKTSSQLLANEQLVNILMPIIIEKTNLYSKVDVLKCIAILENFFNNLTQNRTKELPRIFNYLYFFKSFKLIMESIQHTQPVVKALILIYNFYQFISPQWRDNITMYLLGKVFFKLFFHWSYQIRIIFYNFLIIKIKYLRIQQMPILPSNTQSTLVIIYQYNQMNAKIQERYQQITTILNNAQYQKKQDVLDYRTVYQKDVYKKMKFNLRKKRQQRQKSSDPKISHSLKQNQKMKREKYSLQNLSILKNYSRKKSNPQDQIRNRSSTQFKFDKNINNKQEDQEKLEITRGNSFYIDMSTYQNSRKFSTQISLQSSKNKNNQKMQDQNSLDDIIEANSKRKISQGKGGGRMGRLTLDLKGLNSKLNYNIYNRQDHQLYQISMIEINYISKGIEQYHQTLTQINKYYEKKGELPKRELEIEQFISDQV